MRPQRAAARNAPKFVQSPALPDVRVDLTRIDGIGRDHRPRRRFRVGWADIILLPPRSNIFACWLGLCPGTKITSNRC